MNDTDTILTYENTNIHTITTENGTPPRQCRITARGQ